MLRRPVAAVTPPAGALLDPFAPSFLLAAMGDQRPGQVFHHMAWNVEHGNIGDQIGVKQVADVKPLV